MITSSGAFAAAPSKLVMNLRPQGEPVPVTMMDRLLPLCQSGRLITACTTGPIWSSVYQVLASHCVSVCEATLWLVKLRWLGGLLAEKVGLLPMASAVRLMLMLSHCDWLEKTCSWAELMVAPGGIARLVKRRPVRLPVALEALPSQRVDDVRSSEPLSWLASSLDAATWAVMVTVEPALTVGVAVGVLVAVLTVPTAVGVLVRALVGDGVLVAVSVLVAVLVPVGVGVRVAVLVAPVAVGVLVAPLGRA